MITSELLQKLAPRTPKAKRDRFLPFLVEACPRYGINTELRVAAFLATCCFESDYFKAVKEYASGWDYDKSKNPRKARELGNTEKGDGPKFKGRSLIQRTGRANYRAFTEYVRGSSFYPHKPDFIAHPETLEEPFWSVESACHFWDEHSINKYADKGNFFAIQGIVNRGSATRKALDYESREKLFNTALRAIPDDAVFHSEEPSSSPDSAAAVNLATLPTETDATVESNSGLPSPQSSFIDRALAPFISAKEKFTQLGIDPASISGSSWVTFLVTKVLGIVALIWAFARDNWVECLVGAALIGIAVWYFSRSKDRQQARTFMQPSQVNTTIVEAK